MTFLAPPEGVPIDPIIVPYAIEKSVIKTIDKKRAFFYRLVIFVFNHTSINIIE